MGEVMGEGPAGRTYGGGGQLDMARLEQKSWVFWSEAGVRPYRGCWGLARTDAVVDGRGDRWQGVGPGWVCAGVPESEGSVLRLGGGGVGGTGGGAVGKGCWFRQLCSMKAAQVSSASPTESWEGSHGWESGKLASKD